MAKLETKQTWALTSVDLLDAYTDFILSRQAMNCTKATLDFYKFTVGGFLKWAEQQGITRPDEVTARYIRQFIAETAARGMKDTTVWNFARAIRTMLLFWHKEGYIQTMVNYEMPKKAKRRLPVLTVDQLQTLLTYCNVREKAIILFMVDSGLRRDEVVRLNWEDIDMQNGLVRVKRGKGQKDRSSVIGARTRRALLAYRKTLKDHAGPLFRSVNTGDRLTGDALGGMCERLSKRTGIHVTPHALRRTFVILSLRAGMDVLHLQALLGHASLDMVYHYAQMVDEDILQAHMQHGPVDNLVNR